MAEIIWRRTRHEISGSTTEFVIPPMAPGELVTVVWKGIGSLTVVLPDGKTLAIAHGYHLMIYEPQGT